MRIKIVPENEIEAKYIKEEEHFGVKEFFIFGVTEDEDGTRKDFHNWSGQYKYLLGSLHYYGELINDERRSKGAQSIQQKAQTKLKIQNPVKVEESPSAEAEDEIPFNKSELKIVGNDEIVGEVVEDNPTA